MADKELVDKNSCHKTSTYLHFKVVKLHHMLRISKNYFKNDQITVAMNKIIDNFKWE